jgi:tetratricopeptide (TPR) repeat protein
MKAGRFDLARLCYTRFLEFFQTAKAYNDRGLASLGLEDVDAALVDFDRALQIGPASEMLFMNRAWARYCRQDKAGAISDYQQVLQINPRNERAAALLGQLQGRP